MENREDTRSISIQLVRDDNAGDWRLEEVDLSLMPTSIHLDTDFTSEAQ